MPAAPRIRPLDLFTREEWTALSRRNNWIGLGMVAHAWAIIVAAIALSVWQPWLIPVSIMLVGARQLGLAILMHEAAHGGLHTNRKINDWVGKWLCAAPIGSSLAQYRPYHLQHHKYTQQDEDPDLILSAPFPITRRSLRRKIVRDLTGQTFFKQRRNQFANALGLGLRPQKGAENRSQAAREAVGPMVATNLVLLAVLTALGAWWAYFVVWLLPMATWFMMITRIRNIAEHAVLTDNSDPFQYARTTLANPLEALLIAPYWVNYHCEHHMFMHLPCYRLGKAHRLLREKGLTDRMQVQHGYWRVLSMAASKPQEAVAA